ncbi:hypothetical protein CBL_13894 [Carabus blaptoides fortunei]
MDFDINISDFPLVDGDFIFAQQTANCLNIYYYLIPGLRADLALKSKFKRLDSLITTRTLEIPLILGKELRMFGKKVSRLTSNWIVNNSTIGSCSSIKKYKSTSWITVY